GGRGHRDGARRGRARALRGRAREDRRRGRGGTRRPPRARDLPARPGGGGHRPGRAGSPRRADRHRAVSGGGPAGADPAGATRPAHGGPAGQFSVPVRRPWKTVERSSSPVKETSRPCSTYLAWTESSTATVEASQIWAAVKSTATGRPRSASA